MIGDKEIEEHNKRTRLRLLGYGYKWYLENDTEASIVNHFYNYGDCYNCASVYVKEAYRNKGIFSAFKHLRFITLKDCDMEAFFKKVGVIYRCPHDQVVEDACRVIEFHYKDKKAERSNKPYINHIYEGLGILFLLGADSRTKAAFALHPIYQDGSYVQGTHFTIAQLAHDYGQTANSYLRSNYKADINGLYLQIELEKNPKLKQLLIADKIQNYKDAKNSQKVLAEWEQIEDYFFWWFDQLGVTHRFLKKALNYIDLGYGL